MKVKTSKETVEKLGEFLRTYDASTEQFLNDLPTPEKYAILAMAWTVQGRYEDFEEAHDAAMYEVSATELTKHLMDFPHLWCHLQDAVALKWDYFEFPETNEKDEFDEDG